MRANSIEWLMLKTLITLFIEEAKKVEAFGDNQTYSGQHDEAIKELARTFHDRCKETLTKAAFDHRHEDVCKAYAEAFFQRNGKELTNMMAITAMMGKNPSEIFQKTLDETEKDLEP